MNAQSCNQASSVELSILGSKSKKLLFLLGGYGFLAIISSSLLLPALNHARAQGTKVSNTDHVRFLHQGLFGYAMGNRDRMPGVNSKGFIHRDDGTEDSLTGKSGHGATVEARYWLMLDSNMLAGNHVISPAESKVLWTSGKVSSNNYSYAMLNIHSKSDALDSDRVRPDQAGRAREWKANVNNQAVMVSDRAIVAGGLIGDNYNNIYSVHTEEESNAWAGEVGWGDGSASFHYVDVHDTKYGSYSRIENDRLFSIDQDDRRNIDVVSAPDYVWDTKSNALLGYTSVGYEDGDIASD